MAGFVRLCELSAYLLEGWYTRGCVTRIDSCRAYNNERGEGYVLTFAIVDDTQSMDCVCFGKHAQALVKLLELGQVYTFKNVRYSRKKAGYSSEEAPFQLLIQDSASVFKTAPEDAATCLKAAEQQVDVNLLTFTELAHATRAGTRINVLGVLIHRDDTTTVSSRTTDTQLERVGVLLEDGRSNHIAITLWNEQARAVAALTLNQPIIMLDVHGEFRDDDGELTLSSKPSTTLYPAHEYDEGKELLEYFSTLSSDTVKTLLTTTLRFDGGGSVPVKLVSAISISVRNRVETEYFRIIAIVTAIPHPPNFYLRCPESRCGTKVHRTLLGRFDCNKCGKTTGTPEIGLTLVLDVQDFSGSAMLTIFNESAAAFLQSPLVSAKTLYENDANSFTAAMNKLRFRHLDFRVCVSKNAQDVFSARCWSIRSLPEAQLTRLFTQMQEQNDTCVVDNSESVMSN